MLKRKILDKLLEWKSNKDKKSLIIEGARQVGKTFIINYFGNNYYERFIYINFLSNPKYKEIFTDNIDFKNVINKLKRYPEFKNINFDNECLLFIDEIQECPEAITSLKFLTINEKFNVIASGSYLGLKFNKNANFSYPVGYIEIIKLNPLDFEEFLWANDVQLNDIKEIKECFNNKKKINNELHQYMVEKFKQYILVGGMPAAINEFIKEENYFKVREIQKQIIEYYFNEANRYANTSDKLKIRECLLSIPNQLSKENNKFMFSHLNNNARSKWYMSAIQWLIDSNIVNICKRISRIENPLNAFEITSDFKLYMSDTGLLCSMIDDSIINLVLAKNENFIFKGALYENMISQILIANNFKLRYFKPNQSLEIDFILSFQKGNPILLEVKSGNSRSKSLFTFLDKNKNLIGIKCTNENINFKNNKILNIPWYLLFVINPSQEIEF
ncbi:ATP-binding protein [Metamycoplasma sualvi]|uniref:ATP-binding protein n=1 Tax=Metamycoplasma sualvi TaxID=2125 RepID=UPI0038734DA8